MTGRQKTVLGTVVAVVLAALAAVLLWPEPQRPAAAAPPPPPSSSPAPSPSPTKTIPYPYFTPGTCFQVPRLSNVQQPTAVPCDQQHDAEAIANAVLPDGLADLPAIFRSMTDLCKEPTKQALARTTDGPRHGTSVGLPLEFYRQGERGVTCALTFKA
ncbi:septum formation family protein [Kitasatospora sp. NPDC059795]|uniref:septum formation family protein n=1 Tax=Kitasatospora sp. NPDC059795 TaxID=3346949 RepID=UPI00366685D3